MILTGIDSQENTDSLSDAVHYNLKSAVTCAVLLQDANHFSAEELFMAIANLSYGGWFYICIHTKVLDDYIVNSQVIASYL